ncbi:hypothetical protein COV81_01670 [Candidatus Peregrinibacteria bacterium CG11_big_fil_rev_8_21_14_0_20_41_10]|nr:MAG: hypothetical protein COV81_01670 [Candidatus Peregrinibacteria bacterium CG11_big_fil_rev_8_21_14_0_20_41_10]
MKKVLLLVGAIMLLAGCSGQNAVITNDTSSYNSTTLNASFNYPSNWEVNDSGTITVASPPTEDAETQIIIKIPAETFNEYETTNKEALQANNTYTAREYGQESALYDLIKVDDHFVGVSAERYMTPEQEAGLDMVLDSLHFEDIVQ